MSRISTSTATRPAIASIIALCGMVGALAVGCSGGAKQPGPPKPAGGAAAVGSTSDPGGAAALGPPTSEVRPTTAECKELGRHIITLAVAEEEATKPPARRLSVADAAAVSEQVFAEKILGNASWLESCEKQSKRSHDCALGATSTAAIKACQSNRGAQTKVR